MEFLKDTFLSDDNPFFVGETDLKILHNRPARLQGGAIMLCENGNATLSIDTEPYEISPNTQITLIPDSVMKIDRTSADFTIRLFYYTRQFFEEAHRQIDPSFCHHLKDFPVYCHKPASAERIQQVFSLITVTYYDRANRFRTTIVANHLRNILLDSYDKIQRNVTGVMTEGYKRKEELYHRFKDLILEHCTRHRNVEFYADKLCISKRYLAAITQNAVRETPKLTIDKHVVQEIKTALTFSDKSLEQIAEDLNFPDQSYMGRYFKRHTGQSPLKYRSLI